jgi:hypothetical protein
MFQRLWDPGAWFAAVYKLLVSLYCTLINSAAWVNIGWAVSDILQCKDSFGNSK